MPPVSAAVRELAGEGDDEEGEGEGGEGEGASEAGEGYTVGALPDARAMGLHS